MVKEQFIGTWKLVLSEFRLSDGQAVYPLGKEATGMLMYDASGHMSAQLMRRDRPTFASDDPFSGTLSEIKPAFEGFAAYFGTYEINEERAIVVHHVEGSLFPNWVGGNQIRFFELSGDRLTLSAPPIPMSGREMTGFLIWERAG
ncbi:lipocalin-like domain-containing protein [Chloroflexota bacterium]